MKYLFIATFLLIGSGLQAQNPASSDFISTDMAIAKFLDENQLVDETSLTYGEVNGSPYLHEDYRLGHLVTNTDHVFENKQLKYNIFLDQMQFRDGEKAYVVATPIKEAKIGTQNFISLFHINRLGYFEVMYNNNDVMVLKKHVVLFRDATTAEAYRDAKPAQFIADKPVYYILQGVDGLTEVQNKKQMQKAFEGSDAGSFIRDHKLNFKDDRDVFKLARALAGE